MPASTPTNSALPGRDITIDLRMLSILVIDDHRFSRTLIKTALRAHGITDVVEATDAAEAFKILGDEDHDIDLVLVDHEMPVLSGVEFTRMVRRGIDVLNPEIPIIMVSGLSALENIIEARNCGIHEFVAKPFTTDVLYKHVLQTLMHPRPFVRTGTYIGPDRRWLNAKPPTSKERRRAAT